ncbi:MAG TPA: prolipoprotein diacylglyceryl transferase [Actinomycetota bacterium]|nr:prolipoprotein diacylglyceryl transferase [Actinomycetota bacterium]
MSLAYIPSPPQGVWHLGPLPVRAYALCIVAGIVAAVLVTRRRWAAQAGNPEVVADIAVWAVAFGFVGGRLYHVLTDPQLYFCDACEPIRALYVWEGGLGIWGAIALGAVGAYAGCRFKGIDFLAFADAAAPGVAVAQALGRWGNYFNQELYGRPTQLPWALEIDPAHRPVGMENVATYHPTFLYESLWDLGVAALVIWADRRFKLDRGRAFALYAALYTAGRGWIEALRIDAAHHFLGLRLNEWTSIAVFVASVTYIVAVSHRESPKEEAGASEARVG